MICGANGQLGRDCTRVFQKNNQVEAFGSHDLDITDQAVVEKIMETVSPDVVINCAAYTNVDKSELNADLAFKVNAVGAGNVASSCQALGAIMVHISTDYVFDGKKELPLAYIETDKTSPLGVYGRSKLGGEKLVAENVEKHMIVRTAWLYGAYGNNFLKTMLRLALSNPDQTIRVVNDQYGSPTWTLRLALQLERLLITKGQGIYHATSEGYCSWYELASYFLKKMEVEHNIIPCTTAQYPTPAMRPLNSILNNARLKIARINRMTGWRYGVDMFISRYRKELLEECCPVT